MVCYAEVYRLTVLSVKAVQLDLVGFVLRFLLEAAST